MTRLDVFSITTSDGARDHPRAVASGLLSDICHSISRPSFFYKCKILAGEIHGELVAHSLALISLVATAFIRVRVPRFAGHDCLAELAAGCVPEFHGLVRAAGGEGLAVG